MRATSILVGLLACPVAPISALKRPLSKPSRPLGLKPVRVAAAADFVSTQAAPAVAPLSAPTLDMPLMAKVVGTQMLVGYTIFNGGVGAEVLHAHGHFDSVATWLLGGLGALPLLALGHLIETSPLPAFAEMNAQTNQLALRMFGPRAQPLFALAVSGALGALVGVVEETLFRGQLLPSIIAWGGENGLGHGDAKIVALGITAIIFALAHVNFLGGLKDILSKDTGVTVALQSVTGLWFGTLALVTGQLGAAIIAHGVYDAATLYATHVSATRAIAKASARGLAAFGQPVLARWRAARGDKWVEHAASLFFLLDSDEDGEVSVEELRLGGATYGLGSVTIAELETQASAGGLSLAPFMDAVAKLTDLSKAREGRANDDGAD